jgi:DNA-binding Lrp family transcriptional regulator
MQPKTVKGSHSKLDAIDKKLIYYLSCNYRMPRKQLAKLVHVSPQTLNYRIRRLEEELIYPNVTLDYTRMHIQTHMLLYTSYEESWIERLEKHPNVQIVMRLIGRKRLSVILVNMDPMVFATAATPGHQPEVHPLTGWFTDSWNGFLVDPLPPPQIDITPYELDSKDYHLLYYLIETPAASIRELATKTKESRELVAKRLRNLERRYIIQKFRFFIDLPQINLTTYYLQITCVPAEIQKVKTLIEANPHSGFLHQSYNVFFLNFIAPSYKDLIAMVDALETKTHSQVELFQSADYYYWDWAIPGVREEFLKRAQTKK